MRPGLRRDAACPGCVATLRSINVPSGGGPHTAGVSRGGVVTNWFHLPKWVIPALLLVAALCAFLAWALAWYLGSRD